MSADISEMSADISFGNVGRHFVFKPSPPRHPYPHLKWRFEKCRLTFLKCHPTFWEKSDMSGEISRKCLLIFREKLNMLVGLESLSN